MSEFWHKARMTISGGVALLSCPCHLPLTLPLLLSLTAGTSLGLWLGENQGVIAALSALFFVGSLGLLFYWSKRGAESCPVPGEKPKREKRALHREAYEERG